MQDRNVRVNINWNINVGPKSQRILRIQIDVWTLVGLTWRFSCDFDLVDWRFLPEMMIYHSTWDNSNYSTYMIGSCVLLKILCDYMDKYGWCTDQTEHGCRCQGTCGKPNPPAIFISILELREGISMNSSQECLKFFFVWRIYEELQIFLSEVLSQASMRLNRQLSEVLS